MKAILLFIFSQALLAQEPPPPLPSLKPETAAGAPSAATGQTPKPTNESISAELESFLEPFIYDPKGRRDPFKPYVEATALDDNELSGPLLPLQQYEIDQLKLVGIIWNVTDPKAMFVDPKNQVHIVRRDERVGKKNGYVAVIREGEVVVVEAVNVNGDLMYSTRVLKMANKTNRDAR